MEIAMELSLRNIAASSGALLRLKDISGDEESRWTEETMS